MALSEREIYEAGMSLPVDARREVALRLLESVPDEGAASESWLVTEVAAAYDALRDDPSRAVPLADVRSRLQDKWAARR